MSGPSRTPPLRLVIALTIAILSAILLLGLSWHASLLDRYEFRQLQTALGTWWLARDGWHWDYLMPLFGPPWSAPMEFPLYQALVAWLHQLTDLPLEQSGRTVSVLAFFACLPAVYDLLGGTGLPRSRRLVVLIVILTCPVYLFYGRTFMIETTALAFAVWFLACLRRGLTSLRAGWLLGAFAFAVVAALTKITTFVVFGIPAAALTCALTLAPASGLAARARGLRLSAALLIAAGSLGLAWAWFAHGDMVKDSNPFTGFLTARELHAWNYGTWALRGDWSFWIKVQEIVSGYVLADGALAVALMCVPFAPARIRWIAALAVAGFCSGPLIFANLYHIHDYYYAANSLLLVGAAGLLLASVWDDPRLPRGTAWLMLGVVAATQGYAYYRGYYSHHRHPTPPPPAIASVIKSHLAEDDVLLVFGDDWNPLLPYYAERRAVMVPGRRENEVDVLATVLAQLPPRRIGAMAVTSSLLAKQPDFVSKRAADLGIDGTPVTESDGYRLYLPAANRLPAPSTPEVNPPPASDPPANLQVISEVTAESWPIGAPAPKLARSQFGIQSETIEDRAAILAHADSELTIVPPAGARNIRAVVGLAPGAYAKALPEASDGVVIALFEQTPERGRRLLLRRALNPATRLVDRGPQPLAYSQASPFRGELIFLITAGPAGNNAYDQAYWQEIRVD